MTDAGTNHADADAAPAAAPTLEYASSKKSGCMIAFLIAMSAASLIIGAAVFTLGFVFPDASGSTSAMILINISIVFGLLGTFSVISQLRMPIRLLLEQDGIVLEGRISRRKILWAEIATLEPGKEFQWGLSGNNMVEVIVLKDIKGKKLAAIPSFFQPFTELAAQIKERSSRATGHETFNLDKEKERCTLQAGRKQFWAKIALPFVLGFGLFMTCMGVFELMQERDLEKIGVTAEAEITRHYLYNDFAPRLEYRFTDGKGEAITSDVLMKKRDWDRLKGSSKVAVRYLPGKTSVNRPLEGLDAGMENPWLMAILGIVFFLMFGGTLCVVAMGYDIESKDGKLRLKRLDEAADLIPDGGSSASHPPPPIPPPLPPTAQPAVSEITKTARPPGITVLAIVNIVYGAFGILFNFGTLLFMLLMAGRQPLQSGGVALTADTSLFTSAGLCVKLLLASLLIVSAFGLLSMRRWGRRLALGAAAGQIVMCLIHIFTSLHEAMAMQGVHDVLGKAGFNAVVAFSLFLVGLGLIYPSILLILLGRSETGKLFKN